MKTVDPMSKRGLLWDVFKRLPQRVKRIGRYISGNRLDFEGAYREYNSFSRFFFTLAELGFLLLDFIGFFELLEWMHWFIKPQMRVLSEKELRFVYRIFGESLPYQRIRIDEKARWICKSNHVAYVSFSAVNSWGPLSHALLVHELVHVWQWQQYGSMYIVRALAAQRSPSGYNYGGVPFLQSAIDNDAYLSNFNFEQQGDIVADFYRVQAMLKTEWGDGQFFDAPVYAELISHLRRVV